MPSRPVLVLSLVILALPTVANAQPILRLVPGPTTYETVLIGVGPQPVACLDMWTENGPVVLNRCSFDIAWAFMTLETYMNGMYLGLDANGNDEWDTGDAILAEGYDVTAYTVEFFVDDWVIGRPADNPVTVFLLYDLRPTTPNFFKFQPGIYPSTRNRWEVPGGNFVQFEDGLGIIEFTQVEAVNFGVHPHPDQRDGTVAPGSTNVPVAILDVIGDGTSLESLTVERVSGDPSQFGNLRLVRDDGDRIYGNGDELLGHWAGWPAPTAMFDFVATTGGPLALGAGPDVLMLLADFGPALSEGMEFALVVTGAVFSHVVWPTSVSVPSAVLTARRDRDPALTVTIAPSFDREVTAGATGVVAATLAIEAIDADAVVHGLTIAAVGSGNDAVGIARLQVVLDGDRNGWPDGLSVPGGDVPLDGAVFLADDGEVELTLAGLMLPAGGRAQLLLVVDFSGGAADGESYGLQLAGVDADGPTLTSPLPQTSAALTVVPRSAPDTTGDDETDSEDAPTDGPPGGVTLDDLASDLSIMATTGCSAGGSADTPLLPVLLTVLTGLAAMRFGHRRTPV